VQFLTDLHRAAIDADTPDRNNVIMDMEAEFQPVVGLARRRYFGLVLVAPSWLAVVAWVPAG
jgi:hypothetical protein